MMIWKEAGVKKGSYLHTVQGSDVFRKLYIHMNSCGYFQCDHRFRRRGSDRADLLFIYIVDGLLQVTGEGRRHGAGVNDIVLLNGAGPFQLRCPATCGFLFFRFDGPGAHAMVDELCAMNGAPVFTLGNALDIYAAIHEPIMQTCYHEQPSEAVLSSVVYTALCMIPQTEAPSDALSHGEALTKDTISHQAIKYIDQHITKRFTVQELADHVHLSRYYFTRLFKKETGHTPQEYVSIAKIRHAKKLLQTTTLTVAEIAETLSYSSPASFTNAFKAQSGVAPSRYRSTMTQLP